jgi:proline racemase
MHAGGFGLMSGDAVMAVTTIALERRLMMPGGDGTSIVYDTPAGTIRARATWSAGHSADELSQEREAREASLASLSGDGAPVGWSFESEAPPASQTSGRPRISGVSFYNVPSFVLRGGLEVKLGSRQIRADIACGGEFYAIVDGENAGVPLDVAHLPELRRIGTEIAQAIERSRSIVHPVDPTIRGIAGTVFTSPPRHPASDLRNVTVAACGGVDRSPCATGTSAVLAVIDAMGMLTDDRPFIQEGLIETRLSSRVVGRTSVGDYPAIVAEIDGSAWITGEHTFIVTDDDPLRNGVQI